MVNHASYDGRLSVALRGGRVAEVVYLRALGVLEVGVRMDNGNDGICDHMLVNLPIADVAVNWRLIIEGHRRALFVEVKFESWTTRTICKDVQLMTETTACLRRVAATADGL